MDSMDRGGRNGPEVTEIDLCSGIPVTDTLGDLPLVESHRFRAFTFSLSPVGSVNLFLRDLFSV